MPRCGETLAFVLLANNREPAQNQSTWFKNQGGDIMPELWTGGSHPLLSKTDSLAANSADALLLIARILIVLVLFLTAFSGSPTAAYLTSLGVPSPALWSPVAIAVELVVTAALVLGVATRYGALLGMLYVVVATVLAHRYWEYPQAQQAIQYTQFLKNIAIFGGLLLVFVNGAGRFSVDNRLSGKR
jgi:putative oxidoreductase